MDKCFDILAREIKDLTKNEVDDLLAELRARRDALVNKGIPFDDANVQASKSVQNDLKLAAAIERRNAAINLRIRRGLLDMIRTSFDFDRVQGLEAVLVGSKFHATESRNGVDQIQDALKRKYVGGLVGDLKRAGMLEVFSTGALDLDIARALRDLENPAVTGKLSKEAVAIAGIVRKWQEITRLEANRAGAWIGKLPDYILTQTHDADRILRQGFDKWYETILPRLDIERMFPNGTPKDIKGWLKETYDNIVTGIHENLGNAEKLSGFKGPGNLAKRQSHERKIHFKSADDWFEYNREFGGGNLRESVVMALERASESIGLMRRLGTNPEANLESIVDAMRQELKTAGRFDELKKLDEWARSRGKGLYSVISGRSRAAVNSTLATAASTVRGIQNLSALGGAALAAVTDPFIAAANARHEGRSLLGTFFDHVLAPMKASLDKMSGRQREAALIELNYFGDGLIGKMGSRFSTAEGTHGVMSRLQRWAFGLNLLRPWTDVGRGAALLGTSGRLAKLAEGAWKDVDEDMQRVLTRYGIGEKEWPILKEAVAEFDQYHVMSPEQVREMDARRLTVLAKERIEDLNKGLAERIQKRAKQDAKELEWIAGRKQKLTNWIERQQERLNERLEKAEGKSAEAIQKVRAGLSKIEEEMEFAAGWWQERVDPQQRVKFLGRRKLRDAGIDEGKALERGKELRADLRQLTRDIAALNKELNANFIEAWEARNEDFIAFADGVHERIKERTEKTNKELIDLEPATRRLLEDAREELATKLETLLYDRMNYAVISPGARTEYFQTGGGQQRGTGLGELARTVMQYKSFSIAFWQNAIQQEMYGRGARGVREIGTAEIIGLSRLLVMSTVAGYLAMTAKDWAKGKSARPPDNVRTWMASAVQGGGFGIYGDFLFGESNRFGQSAIETLAGPTAGDAADLVSLLQSARNGDDPSAKALRFAVNNTPYMNLFYTRLAMDHLFLYELQEQLNPGYLRRMEKRVEDETGAEWNVRPTEALR